MPRCLLGNEKKIVGDYNYAGFNVMEKGNYAFPSRIKAPLMPGVKNKHFLCKHCVNTYNVECSVHGILNNDDSFDWGRPPRCHKCEEQLKTINNSKLPEGFWGLVPLTKIVNKSGKYVENGFLACSDDNEIHIVRKDLLFSAEIEKLTPTLTFENEHPILTIQNNDGGQIKSCHINLKDIDVLRKSVGSWINLWRNEIIKNLGIKDSIDLINIASIKMQTLSKNKFSTKLVKKYSVSFCVFADGKIMTYPEINLPSMDNLKYWNFTDKTREKELKMAFTVKGVPYILNISELFSSTGFNSLDDFINFLPRSLISNDNKKYSLSSKGIFEVNLYPGPLKKRVLFEIIDKSISLTTLPEGQKIIYDYGFPYNQTYLLFSKDHNNKLTANCSNSAIKVISATISEPQKLLQTNSYQFGTFLDKDNPSLARTLALYKDGFTIDSIENVEYANIEKIELNNLTSELCELMIQYKNGVSSNKLNFVALEEYAYNAWEAFEVNKANSISQSMETTELYKEYNYLKKNNLIIGLFADIILLSRELDMDIRMNELAEKLAEINANEFHDNKNIREATIKKLLLLSLSLPNIKQNFEYLSAFYPYYQIKCEMGLIADAFGTDIAEKMVLSERKRVVSSSRRNVKYVQSHIQRAFSEIERAIIPVEQAFEREKIKKSLSSIIQRYFPHGAQGILIGTMVATGAATGGMGFLVGMLGIRGLSDTMNYLQKDRETSAQIKRVAENVFSWWQVFKDTLPVAIFEVGELIDNENSFCVQRDKKILDQFPSSNKDQVTDRLNCALRNKIKEGTKSRFVEILEGSGIRFSSLATNIQVAIEIDMPQKLENILDTLALPQSNNNLGDKNGQQ